MNLPGAENTEDRWGTLLRVTRSWRLEWKAGQLLERVAREASEFLGLERSVVWVAGKEGLSAGAQWSQTQAWDGSRDLQYSREVAQAVVHSGRAVFAHDVSGAAVAGGEKPGAESRRVYCVPLTASRGILGALYLDSQESGHGLTQKDQEFLEMLGLQAAAALEHALLYQSAITDPLTRLFSHRHFQQEVEQAIRRAVRSAQPLSLAIMDLDHFKVLNDSCGHEVGNQCLIQIAAILRETLRTTDLIARFGGDEFEILLPNTSASDAASVAEKIRRRIGETVIAPNRQVTATIGVAAYPENAIDGQALFLRADEALYRAKEQGRNLVVQSGIQAPSLPPPITQRAQETDSPELSGLWTLPQLETPHLADTEQIGVDLHANLEEQVDGHRIVRRLGTGASGEVLLVRQPDLDREVALKRPLTPYLTQEQMEAFEREARVTAALVHPGVVTVHTMGRDLDGRRYYTMKPLRGLSLLEILKSRRDGDAHTLRTYTENRLLEILQRASETIAYAHQQGVVHLDLTPTNILVGEFGEVTIIDWGSGTSHSSLRNAPSASLSQMAEKVDKQERRPLLAGSPAYLAPEHLPGSKVRPGPFTDVHSLGSILYEILTERPPFLKGTTRETLDAIGLSIFVPPEIVKPEAGVDPTLSELCSHALQRDTTQRISAAEFADRLGRFVRREQDWEIVRFDSADGLENSSNWTPLAGTWQFKDGEWLGMSSGDQILVWKVPVPGSFRFVAEAWSEEGSELSILGCGADAGSRYQGMYEGYFFEFGADAQTATKLARHGHDIFNVPGLTPEPGRRYRMEIAYEEGWLHCFLDGKRIFTYRELFPFLGRHIGFYTFGKGAHFKPLEVHRQNWGLQVPAIRVADDLLRHGSYDAAIERYQQLADLHHRRLEGDEARMKIGIALARSGRTKAARLVFQALQGSAFEPFALAEEAMLDLRLKEKDEKPEHALELFRRLLKEFPESQAKTKILEARANCSGHFSQDRLGLTYVQDLEWRLNLQLLGRQTLNPPANSQVKCHIGVLWIMNLQGEYAKAWAEGIAFCNSLDQKQSKLYDLQAGNYRAALATGQEAQLDEFLYPFYHNPRDLITHRLARNGAAKKHLASFENMPRVQGAADEYSWGTNAIIALEAHLILQELDRAAELYHSAIAPMYNEVFFDNHYFILLSLLSPSIKPLLIQHSQRLESLPPCFAGKWVMYLQKWIQARAFIESGDLTAAASLLNDFRFPSAISQVQKAFHDDLLVLQALLASLDLLKTPDCKEMEARTENYLAGTPLDLARIFQGKKAPEPGERWPHPLWHPEWRLWLAIWLEARGEKAQARKVATPALDSRYGHLNSQPALIKLLERLR